MRIRLTGGETEMLDEIAGHYFGVPSRNRSAALRLMIRAEFASITGSYREEPRRKTGRCGVKANAWEGLKRGKTT